VVSPHSDLPWLVAPLADAVANQRSHALLVQGAAGVGVLPFMLALAQAWLCETAHATAARPCGHCSSCRLATSRLHPDLLVLLPETLRLSEGWPLSGDKPDEGDGESGKARRKPSRQLRIDEVRGAIDWVQRTSARGHGKVVVLHPADAMNHAAASALLKTLEEPPAGTRILLSAADPEHLLPTVRSRCQHLRLPMPARDTALDWLAGHGVAEPDVLLAAVGGWPLAARALAEAGITAAVWRGLPVAVARGQGAAMAGWPVPRVVDALHKLCHDAMVQAAGGRPRYFPPGSVPAGAGIEGLTNWHRELSRIARHDEHPWHEALLLDSLLAQGRLALAPAPGARRFVSTPPPLDTLGG
jgi:DNA polymerase III subunit delta'